MPAIELPDLGLIRRRGREARDEASRRGRDARKGATEFSLANIDLSKVELPKVESSKLDLSRIDFSRLDPSKLDLSRLDLPTREEVVKQLRKASKEPIKRATQQLDRALPTRRRSRAPFAILGAIGGLTAGWILATSPTARATIERGITNLRATINEWMQGYRSTGLDELETDLGAYPQPTGTVVPSDTYAAAIGAQRSGIGAAATVGESSMVPGEVGTEAGVGVGPGGRKKEGLTSEG
jgi:hypothetical protein